MRVTQRMMSDNMVNYLNDNREMLAKVQEQIASNKQFVRASDNPSAAAASLTLRSSIEINQGYLDSAHVAMDWMTASDFAVQQMDSLGLRSNTLVLNGVSDTRSLDERRAVATELNEILKQAIDLGNTSHNDNFIFGGFKTTTKPFTGVDTDVPPDGMSNQVTYNGDAGTIIRTLSPGQQITLNINGNDSFMGFFNALIEARDAMLSNDTPRIVASMTPLKNAINTASMAGVMNGARQNEVSKMIDRTTSAQLELKALLSQKEDINLAEAITQLNQQESVYQSVLQVSKRAISTMSLFDVLG